MNQFSFKSINSPALLGAFWMIAAGAFFAAVNTSIQAATMWYGLPSTSVAFWQYLIALGFAVPWLMGQGLSVLRTRQIGLHVARVVLGAAGVQFWTLGLAHVPIWQAIALIMTSPFFVVLGAALFFGERIGFARGISVAVGFAGGMIILAPWSDGFGLPTLLPLLASFLWAMSSLMVKKLTVTEGAGVVTVYLFVLLTPFNAAFVLADGASLAPPPWGMALAVVLLAGFLTGLAQYAISRAYKAADAAYLQPYDYLKLPLNVGLGIAVFGFYPAGSMWIGAALIVGASAYIFRQESRMEAALAEQTG